MAGGDSGGRGVVAASENEQKQSVTNATRIRVNGLNDVCVMLATLEKTNEGS